MTDLRAKAIGRIKARFALCEKCLRLKKKWFPREHREQAMRKAQRWSMKSRNKWSNPILITDAYIEKNKDFHEHILNMCAGCPYKDEHVTLMEYKDINICKKCSNLRVENVSWYKDRHERYICSKGSCGKYAIFVREGIPESCPYALEHLIGSQKKFETELNFSEDEV